MPVDRGNPGAASVYYGTGESEQRRRDSRDNEVLRNAWAEGVKDAAYAEGQEWQEDSAYNEGLVAEGRELQNTSMWRTRAIRRTGQTPGRH